jgi:FkbM family methyltransferase
MKKLLFITPHLSTGGQPQYLYKQIQSLINDYEIYCIEWDNHTGGKLVVQRNRIQSILGNRLITLGEDKNFVLNEIVGINPDIIHFQELPEYFIPYELALRIYKSDRRYKIIETSHDSGFDINAKLHFPDRFLMVSDYQVNKFKELGIPTELVEYPIEAKTKTRTREEVLTGLGLDPNLKHVVNVGLFTPRKNQAEIVEYARALKDYPIQFHFIGNQADNFKHYWEPIMQDFPSNCKWWGERSDVNTFYEMADLFLFTSRGHQTDKETMPLVIREAIGWGIPSLIYNLDVYLGYFDKYENIQYLKSNDLDANLEKIIETLGLKKNKNEEIKKENNKNKIFIIDAYATTDVKLNLLRDCIKSIKTMQCPIMIVSHCTLPEDIVSSVDYHLYDSDNRFNVSHNYAYDINEDFSIVQYINYSHEFPIIRSMRLALTSAKSLGYEYFYFCEFDHKYSEKGIHQILDLENQMLKEGKEFVFFYPKEAVFGDVVGEYYETSFFIGKIESFLNQFNSYFPIDLEVYNQNFASQFPNCLEYFFYKCFNQTKVFLITKYVKDYFWDSKINASSYQNIKYDILLDEEKSAYLVITSNDLIGYNFEVSLSDKKVDSFLFENNKKYKIVKLNDSCTIKIKTFITKDLFETKLIEYNVNDFEKYSKAGQIKFNNQNNKEQMILPIDLKFDENENKFTITYLENIDKSIIISIKDIDSKVCIYSMVIPPANSGAGFWIIPLPKNVIDFKNHPNFGGFLIEYYDDTHQLIETKQIKIKEIPIKKPELNISNTEPIFMNYEEFFIDGIYDSYDVDNCKVVFDIGANVGLWTKYILSRNAKKVYCFEPNKKALNHLKNTLNNNQNVTIIDKAIYQENTSLKFYVNEENSLISSLIAESGHSPSYDVTAITLEEAIKDSNEEKIDLIKIDVEGAEFGIIDTLSKEIAEKIDSFLIEYHDMYFDNGMDKVETMNKRLKQLGFFVEQSTIKNTKFIYASKIKKNYWLNKNQQVKLYDLYNFSKEFTWDKMWTGRMDGNNHMFKEMHFTYDEYTSGCVYERFGCKIEDNDIVVDLGANIGVFSNAAYYKGASKIYSFEPSQIAFECLIRNKPINSEVFKMGVSNKNGFENIFLNSTDDTMCGTFVNEGQISEFVPVTTLDSLFENNIFEKIDFLKIDVEGYERKVLEGISDKNLSKVNKVSLEFHGNILNEDDSKYIMDRMTSNGFSSFQLFLGDGTLKIYNFWK